MHIIKNVFEAFHFGRILVVHLKSPNKVNAAQ